MTANLRYDTATRVAQWLEFLKFDDLKAFQTANGLTADGVFGKRTFQAMREAIWSFCLRVGINGQAKVSMPASQYDNGKGYNFFRLRVDAAYWYAQLYDVVYSAGGIITSAGSDRSLDAPKTAGRVGRSFHHAAIAFDLATGSGMNNPATDPFVIECVDGEWIVWATCFPTRAHAGKLPELRTIANPITSAQRFGTKKPVTGHFLNFTEAAARFGFRSIRPRKAFFAGGNYMGAEWWHFQNEWCLVPGFSRFEEEIARLFTPAQIAKAGLGDAVFGKDWF